MLFMAVFSYAPEKRNEVLQRRTEKGPLVPEGMKLLGEWSYIGFGRVFRLYEVSDPVVAVRAGHAWSDLGKIETFPLIETDKLIALMRK